MIRERDCKSRLMTLCDLYYPLSVAIKGSACEFKESLMGISPSSLSFFSQPNKVTLFQTWSRCLKNS